MKFTLTELNTLVHSLEVAIRSYEATLADCKVSDDRLSCYQIFKGQIVEAQALIEKIKTTEI